MQNVERFRGRAGYPHINELNVAAVCAGYAFEFIYKVLVMVSEEQPKPTRRPSDSHAKLAEQDRIDVERIIINHGWMDIREFLSYLDVYLCDKDRKYWMQPRPPTVGPARGRFSIGGLSGYDKLGKLHTELSNFAMKRINESRHEEWPGTQSPTGSAAPQAGWFPLVRELYTVFPKPIKGKHL